MTTAAPDRRELPAADLPRAELLRQRAALLPELRRRDTSVRRAFAGLGVTLLESVLLAMIGAGVSVGGVSGAVTAAVFLVLAAAALRPALRLVRAGHTAIVTYHAWLDAPYQRPGPPVLGAPVAELTVLDAADERLLDAVARRDRDDAQFSVTDTGVVLRAAWTGLALALGLIFGAVGAFDGQLDVRVFALGIGVPFLVSSAVTGAGVARRSIFFTKLRPRIGRLAKQRRAELLAHAASPGA